VEKNLLQEVSAMFNPIKHNGYYIRMYHQLQNEETAFYPWNIGVIFPLRFPEKTVTISCELEVPTVKIKTLGIEAI
jgi:hypothetical protein